MFRRLSALAFPASLALLAPAGCSPSPDQPPEENHAGNAGGLTSRIKDDEAILPEADSNGAAPANGGTVTADGPESPDRIPRALRGRWGMTRADCAAAGGNSKGLLTITGTSLRFYESVGSLRTIVEWAPRRLHAGFAFTGEGMSWNREMALDLDENGALTRRDFGKDAEPGPMVYARCPA